MFPRGHFRVGSSGGIISVDARYGMGSSWRHKATNSRRRSGIDALRNQLAEFYAKGRALDLVQKASDVIFEVAVELERDTQARLDAIRNAMGFALRQSEAISTARHELSRMASAEIEGAVAEAVEFQRSGIIGEVEDSVTRAVDDLIKRVGDRSKTPGEVSDVAEAAIRGAVRRAEVRIDRVTGPLEKCLKDLEQRIAKIENDAGLSATPMSAPRHGWKGTLRAEPNIETFFEGAVRSLLKYTTGLFSRSPERAQFSSSLRGARDKLIEEIREQVDAITEADRASAVAYIEACKKTLLDRLDRLEQDLHSDHELQGPARAERGRQLELQLNGVRGLLVELRGHLEHVGLD